MEKNKRKLNYKRLIIFLLIASIILYCTFALLNAKITSFFISGNSVLSDQEILEFAEVDNYPNLITSLSPVISNRLEEHNLIVSAKVSKSNFSELHIEIEEASPMFFNSILKQTVFSNGYLSEDLYSVPYLINYVPDLIYEEFIEKMGTIDLDVINKISEIKYDPNDVDDERFLFLMSDGIYVYLTVYKLEAINEYLSISQKVEGEKGILYLDYGNSFTIVEE